MLVIKNGKIVTMTGRLIDGGDILTENGVIREIHDTSEYEPHSDDTVIDATDCFVFPGFIDMHTHCGLDGTRLGDVYLKERFIAPEASTYKSINPQNEAFYDCICSGVTSVMVAPFDEQIVGGKCCVVKTYSGDNNSLNTVSEFCGIKFSLCGMSGEDSVVLPDSIPRFIKKELRSALEYISPNTHMLQGLMSPALDSYKPMLLEKMPAFISVSDEMQLSIAESIIKDFNLNGVLVLRSVENTPAYSSLFENKKTPFIINPINMGASCRKQFSSSLTTQDFAVSSYHPHVSSDILPVNVGMLVRDGLDMQSGFESITTKPAQICRLYDKIGSLSVGMDADIVVWNDNPLEVLSNVLYTVIDGKVVYSGESQSF